MSNTRIAEELAAQVLSLKIVTLTSSDGLNINCDIKQATALIQTALDTQRAEYEREHEWQPIETARRDGKDIQLCMYKKGDMAHNTHYVVKTCHWEHRTNTWRISGTSEDMRNPTHWRPLPAAPEAIKSLGV